MGRAMERRDSCLPSPKRPLMLEIRKLVYLTTARIRRLKTMVSTMILLRSAACFFLKAAVSAFFRSGGRSAFFSSFRRAFLWE